MSKIERALERAKQKRRSILTGSDSGNQHVPVAPPQKREKKAKETPLVKTIAYAQTKRIPINPKLLEQRKLMVPQNGRSRAAEAYRLLKAQILKKSRDRGWNTLMVTSAGQGEGKTLTAINLAMAISQELSQTSLLVEADLREPKLHRFFGLERRSGLSDHLIRNVPLSDLLINPGIDRFVFLPGGRAIPNAAEMLASPRMQEVVVEMKQRYPDRYVVFDLPPLFECADPLVFSDHVDGVLLVVEAYKTTTDHLKKAMELLEGKNVLGTVLNKVRVEKKLYYSYYR
jgi:non-specific protein-tyrosine kinase